MDPWSNEPALTVTAVDQRYAWGCVCTLEASEDVQVEERKLGFDRFRLPVLLCRRLDVAKGETRQAMFVGRQLVVGERVSAASLKDDTDVWTPWH